MEAVVPHRDNVQALCDKRGIPNPIQEDDLKVGGLIFFGGDGAMYKIAGTDMNRASRLFFEEHARNFGNFLEDNPPWSISGPGFRGLRELAVEYYAELWGLDRPLLNAFAVSESVQLFWKPFDEERFSKWGK